MPGRKNKRGVVIVGEDVDAPHVRAQMQKLQKRVQARKQQKEMFLNKSLNSSTLLVDKSLLTNTEEES